MDLEGYLLALTINQRWSGGRDPMLIKKWLVQGMKNRGEMRRKIQHCLNLGIEDILDLEVQVYNLCLGKQEAILGRRNLIDVRNGNHQRSSPPGHPLSLLAYSFRRGCLRRRSWGILRRLLLRGSTNTGFPHRLGSIARRELDVQRSHLCTWKKVK